MAQRLRVYVELAKRGYRRYSSYTTAAVAGLFTNVVFGMLRAAVMGAVFVGSRHIGGYGLAQAVTYVWLAQGLMTVVQMYGGNDLASRISAGDITIDLIRPVDTQLGYLATDCGRAAYHALYRGVPPVVIGALIYGLVAPADPLVWLAFLTSLVLAVVVSYFFRFLYNTIAFWLLDYRGVALVAVIVTNLLSGFIIPVAFFPHWLAVTALLTPFPSMIQTPVDIFTGHSAGLAALGALGIQAVWVGVLFLAGRSVFLLGKRTLVVQGG
jgi:ABC-2 type transport system permease protein